jgi:hypothetical protein
MASSPVAGRKITREIIESDLKCRRKSALLLAGEQGSKSDYELLLTEAGERARTTTVSKLISDSKEVVPRRWRAGWRHSTRPQVVAPTEEARRRKRTRRPVGNMVNEKPSCTSVDSPTRSTSKRW